MRSESASREAKETESFSAMRRFEAPSEPSKDSRAEPFSSKTSVLRPEAPESAVHSARTLEPATERPWPEARDISMGVESSTRPASGEAERRRLPTTSRQ